MSDDPDSAPPVPSAASSDDTRAPALPNAAALEVPQEVLNQLPGPVRQQIGIGFAATMAPALSGPDRLLERIPQSQAAEVVSLIVAHSDKELEFQHVERMANIQARERQNVHSASTENQRQVRAQLFAAMVIVLGVLVALYCLHTGKDQAAVTLLSSLLSAAGGYGLGRGSRERGRG